MSKFGVLIVLIAASMTSSAARSADALTGKQAWGLQKAAEWKLRDEELDAEFRRLLGEAERQKDTAPEAIEQLLNARKSWEQFSTDYCAAVSQIFGGAWSGQHQDDCIANQKKVFTQSLRSYNW